MWLYCAIPSAARSLSLIIIITNASILVFMSITRPVFHSFEQHMLLFRLKYYEFSPKFAGNYMYQIEYNSTIVYILNTYLYITGILGYHTCPWPKQPEHLYLVFFKLEWQKYATFEYSVFRTATGARSGRLLSNWPCSSGFVVSPDFPYDVEVMQGKVVSSKVNTVIVFTSCRCVGRMCLYTGAQCINTTLINHYTS